MVNKIGIDVGGTNTDAAILNHRNEVIAKVKTPTTPDVSHGIERAMATVLEASGTDRGAIEYCMLGTTHCVNAILERSGLDRVAVIRIGAPASKAIPPLFDWPVDLRDAVCHERYLVEGGNEFDGRPIGELNESKLKSIGEELAGSVKSVAITSIFSPVSADQEKAARDILAETMGDSAFISVSHEIATIGLLERENATVLNAALRSVSRRAVRGFREAVKKLGLESVLYLGQNDGTLMNVDAAIRYPILTVASGPTNSIRGAAFLAGVKDSIVVDVGGTSTDIGLLKDGFPLESARPVVIGGVRTNFRMPDMLSLALGGGSRIRFQSGYSVGPDSVGYRLTQESIVFGGTTLTATDVAVALGRCQLGDRRRMKEKPRDLLKSVDARVHAMVEDGIDKVRTTPDPLPVVLVGGGSVLLRNRLKGVSKVIRPEHFDVANAIGVAIAEVGADVDTILTYESTSRREGIDKTCQIAIDRAIASGADPRRTRIANVEEIPITYLPGNAVRVRVKACGALGAAA
jgi:N-methylhydantoinase A/oxoprolinase/acetone carboxylase beta subunit